MVAALLSLFAMVLTGGGGAANQNAAMTILYPSMKVLNASQI